MPSSFQRSSRHPRNPGRKHRRIRERLGAYNAEFRPFRRRIPRSAVPSFFTLMNLFSGYVSIIQSMAGRFDEAAWLIVLASFFDVLDGMMARLTKTNSLFGVELDSLSDVVSFGAAPSFLVYTFGLNEFGILGLVVSSLPLICGAMRLARFNTSFDGEKKDYFVGLPIPGMAISLVALILTFDRSILFGRISLNNMALLIPVVIALSFLMVATIPFDAIPKPTPRYIRQYPRKTLIYTVGLALIIVFQQVGLLVTLTIYLLYGVGRSVYNIVQAVLNYPLDDGKTEDAPPVAK